MHKVYVLKLPSIFILAIISLVACDGTFVEPLPQRDHVHFPVGLATHPTGDYLYVVNSNFDARYREELGGTVSVIDLETRQILSQNSPFIPSFGGSIQLNEDASRAYVATRQSNAVVSFALSSSGDRMFCDTNAKGEKNESTSDPEDCTLRRVPDTENSPVLPADPYDLDVSTIEISDDLKVDLVNISHLRGNNVSSMTIPYTKDGKSVDLSAASLRSVAITDGSGSIARRPGTRDIFVGDRRGGEIVVYSPYFAAGKSDIQAMVVRSTISLTHDPEIIADVRGMSFSPDGNILYAVTRSPDAVHIIDLGARDPDRVSGTLYLVVDVVPIDNQPSDLTYHIGPNGPLLYIPSFAEGSIVVVDPRIPAIVDRIEVTDRPSRFVVNKGQCRRGKKCEAYVSFFDDTGDTEQNCADSRSIVCGSIGIIDLDPNSNRYHQLVGKIF